MQNMIYLWKLPGATDGWLCRSQLLCPLRNAHHIRWRFAESSTSWWVWGGTIRVKVRNT